MDYGRLHEVLDRLIKSGGHLTIADLNNAVEIREEASRLVQHQSERYSDHAVGRPEGEEPE